MTPIAAINLSNINFSYKTDDGPLPVLKEIDLSIPQHQICGLVGPSGCGKTTALRLIADLMRPNHIAEFTGKAVVFGQSPLESRRMRRLSLVPQNSSLFPWWSVLENVLLPARIKNGISSEAISRAKTLLDEVGLLEFCNSPVVEISAGMQRRVAIARALLHSGDLMLLDEPLSSLDELARDEISMLLQCLWDRYNTTALMISHDLTETVQLCDRVIVFSPRPSRIIADFVVQLPRPRTYEDRMLPAFTEAVWQIRNAFSSASFEMRST